jgi:hypothetical protein
MKKFSLLLVTVLIIGAAFVFTQQAQNNTPDQMPIKSIPEMEAERLSRVTINRDDTGRLTTEALVQEREPISTHSKLFVMESVKASSVKLPITGEQAKILFFSPSDGNLDVELIDPVGNYVNLVPHSRNKSGESEEFSNLVLGRGNPIDGVMLLADQKQMSPGIYMANVRQSKQPIDIIVNDEGGPELNLSMAENGFDSTIPVTIYARLDDSGSPISGAKLSAKVRGMDSKRFKFEETAPGVYSVKINPSKLDKMTTFIVEASGNTAAGLQFLRHGSIEAITGKSNANLIGVWKEELNKENLVVEVKVQVSVQGRYYMRGNLLGPTDEPIAWAQDAQELSPGQHTMTLRFARELINQSGQNRGFKLTDVQLMNTSEMPGVKAPKKILDYFLKSSL